MTRGEKRCIACGKVGHVSASCPNAPKTTRTCAACAKAATDWRGAWFEADCPDCEIRAIATSEREAREWFVDRIAREAGAHAARECRRRINDEVARIAALKGRTC